MYTLSAMQDDKLNIHGKFQSIMGLTRQLEQSPKRFGTDTLLSHSEIHLIEIIGDNQDLSVTDLSRCLSVTKGAVSQALKRLGRKGFTLKRTDPDNLSRMIVELTSKGQTAYWAHKHWHETMDGGFAKYMDELGTKESDIILTFLEKVEDFLSRRIESDA